MKIKLYKAFGLLAITPDIVCQQIECMNLRKIPIPIEHGDKKIVVSVGFGKYGKSKMEKHIIQRSFLDKYNTSEIPAIPTLNMSFDFQIIDNLTKVMNATVYPNDEIKSLEKEILNTLPIVKQAVDRFYFGYGKFKLEQQLANNKTWSDIAFIQKLLQPPSLKDLQTYLFYEVGNEKGEKVRWVISEGDSLMSSPLSSKEKKEMKKYVKNGIGFPEELFLHGLALFNLERYREAYLNIAIALEIALTTWLRKKLIAKEQNNESQIDKFIQHTSKRTLMTVLVRYIKNIEPTLLEKARKVFDTRNGIAHGLTKKLFKQQTQEAIDVTYQFLQILK